MEERVPFLEAYFAAYRRANPGQEPPRVHYRGHGWYGVEGRENRRRKDFEAWTETLNKRVVPQS